MSSTVTAKGQVAIPKAVRDLLRLAPGGQVEFRRNWEGEIVLARTDAERPPSRFARLRGHAEEGLSTDAILALTRGEP